MTLTARRRAATTQGLRWGGAGSSRGQRDCSPTRAAASVFDAPQREIGIAGVLLLGLSGGTIAFGLPEAGGEQGDEEQREPRGGDDDGGQEAAGAHAGFGFAVEVTPAARR